MNNFELLDQLLDHVGISMSTMSNIAWNTWYSDAADWEPIDDLILIKFLYFKYLEETGKDIEYLKEDRTEISDEALALAREVLFRVSWNKRLFRSEVEVFTRLLGDPAVRDELHNRPDIVASREERRTYPWFN